MLPTDNLSEVTLSEYVKSRGDPPFLDPKTSVPTAEKLAQFHASVTKAGVVCVLLAAGQGSRFVSDIPKVIYPYSSGGEGKSMPLASISMNAAFECGMPVVAIVGHARERVVSTIDREDHPVLFVVQEEQMGTGHAVYLSRFALPDDFDGDIIVTYADNPGIDSQILKELTNEHAKYSGADAKYGGLILTGSRKDAGAGAEAYGRIVRKSKQGNTGVIVDIVEKKTILKLRADNACKTYEGGAEWTGDELWDIDEFNSGIVMVKAKAYVEVLGKIKASQTKLNPPKFEYYATDFVKGLVDIGLVTQGWKIPKESIWKLEGANTVEELKELEEKSAARNCAE